MSRLGPESSARVRSAAGAAILILLTGCNLTLSESDRCLNDLRSLTYCGHDDNESAPPTPREMDSDGEPAASTHRPPSKKT
jgi:hypothetical protein